MDSADRPGLSIVPADPESQRTMPQPTPLQWCPTCDRFIHVLPDEHAEFHVGRDVESSRTPEARAEWRKILAVADYGTAA